MSRKKTMILVDPDDIIVRRVGSLQEYRDKVSKGKGGGVIPKTGRPFHKYASMREMLGLEEGATMQAVVGR
jgi:hypothetical protein